MKKIVCFLLTFWIAVSGCQYAKSNQQVLVSTDCGMSWSLIQPGDAVPKGVANPCFQKVILPNFPMQGQAAFVANLRNKVRVKTRLDYDYSIFNGLPFIKEAKYLGKRNKDADDKSSLDPGAFEAAENSVIDVRIRDVAKSFFLNEDVVDMDIASVEERLTSAINKVLETRGVRLNFVALTFELDEQTRQAIDVATAMRIYETNNLGEVGKQVMNARAGATKVIVQSWSPPESKKEED